MIKNEDAKEYKTELLAPAKNKDCAYAAINAGADAVYIGSEAFGARKKAGNSLEDIKEIVDYAHKFLVKIYVTVNTILFDNELKEAEKLIWKLYEIGVDAVIFQDFAFFEMDLPPIALHASTQCNIDDIKKIQFLKEMNVERVVLPREFSLREIKEITQNIDIETEVFVHGALCVSYSGQCYFSDYIGGRSANRGECAQPCRKKYALVDENGKTILKPQYLLSMKDNNLSRHLKELVNAGVTSLKIEGRLKDKDYVTNVVSYYRNELDKISKNIRPTKGLIKTDFEPDVDKTFNRGYTNFYFDGQRKCFINPSTPKFLGEKIGKVISLNGRKIKIETKAKLHVSDKLSYFDSSGDLTGTTVTIVDKNGIEVLNTGSIRTGTVLYRNFDSSFNKKLHQAEFKRKLPIEIKVSNEKIILKSFDNNKVSYPINEEFEKAQNQDKAKENVVKQLSKLGDTEFAVSKIEVSEDFNLFIPVSKLNEIRRGAISLLQNVSKENYEFQRRENVSDYAPYPYKKLDYSFNIANSKAELFYEKCGCEIDEYAPECKKYKSKITLMKTKHCLRDYAGICLKKNKDNRTLYLVDEHGKKYTLSFDCKNCIMNIEIEE